MHAGKFVFSQLMSHIPLDVFRKCVAEYASAKVTYKFSHWDQFLSMAFAQLTFRESLRDIETCLRSHESKLYHLGIRGGIARSTLADANESRDCRIYQDFALHLIQEARRLYAGDKLAMELAETVYALDTTTIDLCLALFPWAKFRRAKAAVKMHTLLDLRGNIPSFIHITNGKVHEVNILDILPIEAGSFYIMDRGFLDFLRLYTMHQAQAFFVIRSKKNELVTIQHVRASESLYLPQRVAESRPNGNRQDGTARSGEVVRIIAWWFEARLSFLYRGAVE